MNNYAVKIKHIRSDNGTEFKNTGLDLYLDTMGITHEFSAPYTPQQNGIGERKNRTLIEMARTMLDEYKTPRKFWPEAIDTACHVINRVYIHKLLNKTSYELLTGKKPNVSYFRLFGARCWIKDPHHKSKFAPKAHEGFMLGYGKDSHSYRVFNLFLYKIVETVDVRFDETNGSQRELLPSTLDEAPPSESIKLMGTGEIMPSEAQPEEELIISAPNQPEDNAQTEDNTSNDDNDQHEQGLHLVHPRVANEVQIEKIIDSINAPGPLTRSRATQLANFCGHFSFVSISEPKKVAEAFMEP